MDLKEYRRSRGYDPENPNELMRNESNNSFSYVDDNEPWYGGIARAWNANMAQMDTFNAQDEQMKLLNQYYGASPEQANDPTYIQETNLKLRDLFNQQAEAEAKYQRNYGDQLEGWQGVVKDVPFNLAGTMRGFGKGAAVQGALAGAGYGLSLTPAAGVGAVLRTAAPYVGGAVAGEDEARMEANSAALQIMQESGDYGLAKQVYDDVYAKNLPATVATDMVASAVGPLGRLLGRPAGRAGVGLAERLSTEVATRSGKPWLGKAATIASGALTGAATEGAQEYYQEWASTTGQNLARQQYAPEKVQEWQWDNPDALHSAAVGALTGGLFGGAGGTVRRNDVANITNTADAQGISFANQVADWNKLADEKGFTKFDDARIEELKQVYGAMMGLDAEQASKMSTNEAVRAYWSLENQITGDPSISEANLINLLTNEQTADVTQRGSTAEQFNAFYGRNWNEPQVVNKEQKTPTINQQAETIIQGQVRNEQAVTTPDTPIDVQTQAKLNDINKDAKAGQTSTVTGFKTNSRIFSDKKSQTDINGTEVRQAQKVSGSPAQTSTAAPSAESQVFSQVIGEWDINTEPDSIREISGAQLYEYTDMETLETKGIQIVPRSKHQGGGYNVVPLNDDYMPDTELEPRVFDTMQEVEDFLRSDDSKDFAKWSEADSGNTLPPAQPLLSDDKRVNTVRDLADFHRSNKGIFTDKEFYQLAKTLMQLNKNNDISIDMKLGKNALVNGQSIRGMQTWDAYTGRALITLYNGADVSTAIHEISHVGWARLSQEDKLQFTRYAMETEGAFACNAEGLEVSKQNIEQMLSPKTPPATAEARQTIRMLDTNATPSVRNLAVEERFCYEFSGWFLNNAAANESVTVTDSLLNRIFGVALDRMRPMLRLIGYVAEQQQSAGFDKARQVFQKLNIIENKSEVEQTIAPERTGVQVETVTTNEVIPENNTPALVRPVQETVSETEQTYTTYPKRAPKQTTKKQLNIKNTESITDTQQVAPVTSEKEVIAPVASVVSVEEEKSPSKTNTSSEKKTPVRKEINAVSKQVSVKQEPLTGRQKTSLENVLKTVRDNIKEMSKADIKEDLRDLKDELKNNPNFSTYERLVREGKIKIYEKVLAPKTKAKPKTAKLSEADNASQKKQLSQIRKDTDVRKYTFTKEALANKVNRDKANLLAQSDAWVEKKTVDGSRQFLRKDYNMYQLQEVVYNTPTGKRLKETRPFKWTDRKHWKENKQFFKDWVMVRFINNKEALKRMAEYIGKGDAYMRMIVEADQGALAQEAITDGIRISPTKRTKGLADIRNAIPINKENEFIEYAIAKRVIALSKRGIKQKMAVDEAEAIIKQVQSSANGKLFEQTRQQLVEYNNALLKTTLVEGGIISQETYDKIIENNPEYIPLKKVMDDTEKFVDRIIKSQSLIDNPNPLKKIKGSVREIQNPFDSIYANTINYYSLAARNKAATTFVNEIAAGTYTSMQGKKYSPFAGLIREVEAPKKGHKAAQGVFYLWEDGKKRYFQTDSMSIYEAIHSLSPDGMNAIKQIIAWPSRFLRATASNTPDFALANLARDMVEATITSEHGHIPLYDSLWGMWQMKTNGAWFREYEDMNGVMAYRYLDGSKMRTQGLNKRQVGELFKAFVNPKGTEATRFDAFKALASKVFGVTEKINEYMEVGTRLAEYKNARMGYEGWLDRLQDSRPATVANAKHDKFFGAFKSKDITVNFAQAGSWGREANKYIPFTNASLQGVYKGLRALDDALFATRGHKRQAEVLFKMALIMSISAAVWGAGQDDPEYLNASEYDRNMYYIIDGFRIPKDHNFGTLFGTATERMLDASVKGNKDALMDALDAVWTAWSPPVLPAALSVYSGIVNNWDTFRERPITSMYDEKKRGYLQVGNDTSALAQMVSSALWDYFGIDASAKKIHWGYQQFFSNTAKYLDAVGSMFGIESKFGERPNRINMNDANAMAVGIGALKSGSDNSIVSAGSKVMYLLLQRFITQNNYPAQVSKFNEKYKELELKAENDEPHNEKEWERYKAANKEMKKIAKSMQSIRQSPDLNGAQKAEKLKPLYQQQLDIVAKATSVKR